VSGSSGAHHEHHLTARGALSVVLSQLRRRAPADFLVELGQLTTHRKRALWVTLGQLRQRSRESPRGLKGHERLLGVPEQTLALGALARKEPDETPALGR
jgi:hypothetical protein